MTHYIHLRNKKRLHELKESLLKTQGGLCAICMKVLTLEEGELDHDHSKAVGRGTRNGHYIGGTFEEKINYARGVLCPACNRGLGHFRDNIALLQQACVYLISTRIRDDKT